MSHLCKGCLTNYNELFGNCDLYNKNGECPCSKCIIKTMCDNSCEEFEAFKESWKTGRKVYEITRQKDE